MSDVAAGLRILRNRLEKKRLLEVGQHPFPILHGDGNQNANVVVVGYEPEPDETAPHSSGVGGHVRGVVKAMDVLVPALWWTYVIKRFCGKLLTRPEVAPWAEFLWDELEIIKPKATILLGAETAWAVLGTSAREVVDLRKKRFVHERAPYTNFFVTYSSVDIWASSAPERAQLDLYLTQDLDAIFNVQRSYFEEQKIK